MVLSAIKLHCKSGVVVNLSIYVCLGKVIVKQTPFAVKHQHPSLDILGEEQGKRANDCLKLTALLKY